VVRSLAQSYHDRVPSLSPTRSTAHLDDADAVQAQVAETRNDSPSASLPMPITASAPVDRARTPDDDDIEANRSDRAGQEPASGFGTSVRELSSSVSTMIWRGFEAVRNTTGFQRRPPDDVDRDR
jgi:hypothetical protein